MLTNGNLAGRQSLSLRTSAHAGVGISLVIETALQITCHSEPVTDVTGVGISLVIETAFLLKMEIATPV